MKKQHVKLKEAEADYLKKELSKGTIAIRVYKRMQALLYLNGGKTYQEVSDLLSVSYPSVLKWSKLYRESGLDFLKDRARSGRPRGISETDRAKITALACSEPPEGYARWSLRLLADKLVELEIVESISFKQVGNILKKTT